jgi:hypothetical protein
VALEVGSFSARLSPRGARDRIYGEYDMADTNWFQIAAALVGGGACGAVINTIVSSFRSRKQPVGRRVDVVPVFRPPGSAGQLEAEIAIRHNGQTASFKNLFIAEAKVVNKGNRDFDNLPIGVTLSNGDCCIHVEYETPDRHHKIEMTTVVSPQSRQPNIDFVLRPFNRGDYYSMKFYLVIPDNKELPGDITFGSASPIKFVAMPTAGEILTGAMSDISILKLGSVMLIRR